MRGSGASVFVDVDGDALPPPSSPPPGLRAAASATGAAPGGGRGGVKGMGTGTGKTGSTRGSGLGRYVPAYLNPKYRLATFKASTAGKEDPNSPYVLFQRRTVRLGFMRKVFAILALQLAATAAMVAVFALHQGVKAWVQDNPGVFYAAWVTTIVLMITLVCCDEARRHYPANYWLLGTFTLCESYLLGTVSSYYDTIVLLLVVCMTCTVTCAFSLYALQTRFDFTRNGGILLGGVVLLLCFGLSLAMLGADRVGSVVYALFGTCLFALFLVYDIQLVVGCKHRRYTLGPDEYVFAALNLYLDVINIFVLLLMLAAGKEGSG